MSDPVVPNPQQSGPTVWDEPGPRHSDAWLAALGAEDAVVESAITLCESDIQPAPARATLNGQVTLSDGTTRCYDSAGRPLEADTRAAPAPLDKPTSPMLS